MRLSDWMRVVRVIRTVSFVGLTLVALGRWGIAWQHDDSLSTLWAAAVFVFAREAGRAD